MTTFTAKMHPTTLTKNVPTGQADGTLTTMQQHCLDQVDTLILSLALLMGEVQNLIAALHNVIEPRACPQTIMFLSLTLLSSLNRLLKLATDFVPLLVVLILHSFNPQMLAQSLPPCS